MPRAVIPPRFEGPRLIQQRAAIERDVLGLAGDALTSADLVEGTGIVVTPDPGTGQVQIDVDGAAIGPSRAMQAFL